MVKAHLNRLRTWSKLSNERLHEVLCFSDAISAAAKAFKRLDYVDDMHAVNNLNIVVDKLPILFSSSGRSTVKINEMLNKNILLDFET